MREKGNEKAKILTFSIQFLNPTQLVGKSVKKIIITWKVCVCRKKMSFRIQDSYLVDSKSLPTDCPAGHLPRQDANVEVYRARCGGGH